jgi:hypothetical protein
MAVRKTAIVDILPDDGRESVFSFRASKTVVLLRKQGFPLHLEASRAAQDPFLKPAVIRRQLFLPRAPLGVALKTHAVAACALRAFDTRMQLIDYVRATAKLQRRVEYSS